MLGNRLKILRNEQFMSLTEVANLVGKSPSTISRYENDQVEKLDLDLIEKLADALETSSAYLLGMTDDSHYFANEATEDILDENSSYILVTDDEMAPEIPLGAYVKIRELKPDEELVVDALYYIEFDNKKVFRIAVDDAVDGLGFLPIHLNERRIAYDQDYANIIGKAVSMKVFFEDE